MLITFIVRNVHFSFFNLCSVNVYDLLFVGYLCYFMQLVDGVLEIKMYLEHQIGFKVSTPPGIPL